MNIDLNDGPIIYRKFIKKVSFEQLAEGMISGNICVVFVDVDADIFKLAIPSYKGIEQLSQEEALKRSTFHSGFVEVLEPIPTEDEDVFQILYNEKTREIVQMINLRNSDMDCTDYFYQHLDSQECTYPTSTCKKKKMVCIY